ncbi:uncharacterized protein LOC102713218 isoform X2 [Oryza brachyantha]|uniref:uncharacterized protein LOC102713218 isoform X2 n=1 Tax=Oryza brachyantha TaxID=4533 RepID=UPI0007766346|nr:uncharacterized protein LOC102713218 isoform X2 [Oryza brachyantha]
MDRTQFRDLVADLVEKYPHEYGDKISLFFFCTETKCHIPVRNDQELVEMFAKHRAVRTCLLSVAYHSASSEPPVLPDWDYCRPSFEPPFTPSIACPSLAEPTSGSLNQSAEPTNATKRQCSETEYLCNPNPMNEHVGVDDEGLYIDMGLSCPSTLPNHVNQGGTAEMGVDSSGDDECNESESDFESSDDEVEDIDDEIKDRELENMPDAFYDKKDPSMSVGTIYSDMDAFKIALASHAVKHEYNYDIEKSDTGRYRVNCAQNSDGCKWRLHASTGKDGSIIQVKKVPYPHTCQSTRRQGICVGVTQFWVCSQVIDWLKEDGNIGPTELQRRLKEHHKILVPYKRVYKGKYLAMDKIYGPWDKSFNNLYRLKAQLEESSPGSFLVIDHHTINKKIRFCRLFFALKACVDGFLRGCRPYLAVDSTFLTGRFRGQLCIACAVDGHNWMYPVAVGVIESETNDNWIWFMEKLREAIGTPEGLTFSTDCGRLS